MYSADHPKIQRTMLVKYPASAWRAQVLLGSVRSWEGAKRGQGGRRSVAPSSKVLNFFLRHTGMYHTYRYSTWYERYGEYPIRRTDHDLYHPDLYLPFLDDGHHLCSTDPTQETSAARSCRLYRSHPATFETAVDRTDQESISPERSIS